MGHFALILRYGLCSFLTTLLWLKCEISWHSISSKVYHETFLEAFSCLYDVIKIVIYLLSDYIWLVVSLKCRVSLYSVLIVKCRLNIEVCWMIWTKAVLSFFFDKFKCVPINKTMSSEHNISARGRRTKFTVWVPNTITLQYEIPFCQTKRPILKDKTLPAEYNISVRGSSAKRYILDNQHNHIEAWNTFLTS